MMDSKSRGSKESNTFSPTFLCESDPIYPLANNLYNVSHHPIISKCQNEMNKR